MRLIWIVISTKLDKNYFKRVMLKWRYYRSFTRRMKASLRLKKAKEERIWIEQSPNIHLLNYPYHKIKRELIKVRNR